MEMMIGWQTEKTAPRDDKSFLMLPYDLNTGKVDTVSFIVTWNESLQIWCGDDKIRHIIIYPGETFYWTTILPYLTTIPNKQI